MQDAAQDAAPWDTPPDHRVDASGVEPVSLIEATVPAGKR
jgi:hypothetical protein